MFSDKLIEELKNHPVNHLEDIMAEDKIKLTPHGSSFVGYHSNQHDSQSKTSLHVDSQQQLYKCWNCNEKGDVFTWLMANRNLSFFQSCACLAERARIELPGVSAEEQEEYEQNRKERTELEKSYNATANIYHAQLLEKHYTLLLEKWGLSSDTVKELKIGYAPANTFIESELTNKGFDHDLIARSGLLNKGGYDHFQGRLIFPYHKNKQAVYFIARKTEDTPDNEWEKSKFKKLLTHNEKNPQVSKAVKNEYFAGEDTARGADELLITEGIADCYAAIQAGFSCISPVTITFRKADFPRLAVLANRAKCVYIVNDNEDNDAGKKGALATAAYLESKGIKVKLVELPKPDNVEKIDLADYLKENTADDLKSLMSKAKTLFELCLDAVAEEPDNSDKRQQAINMLAKMGGIDRDINIEKFYRILKPQGITKKTLQIEVEKVRKQSDKQKNADESEGNEQQTKTPLEKSKEALAKTDRELIEAAEKFLKMPELVELIIKHIELLGLVGERALGLALHLTFTSRLLSKPLAAIVLGTSSSGKSFAISQVGRFFPDESVLKAHRITPAALHYLPKGSLIHRAVIAGERSRIQEDTQAEATRALREMLSDQILRLIVTGKDDDGNPITLEIEQPGPIAYAESTTLGMSKIFDEDRTRSIFLGCDESEAQSQKIIERLATESQSPMRQEEIESIISLHHTAQRLLKPYVIVIPFAKQLTTCLPARKPECRRAFGYLLSLIKAVSLLHQYQREKTEDGNLIATLDDYEVVRQYLTQPIAIGLGVELTAGAARLLEVIESNYEIDDPFTAHDLKEETGLANVVYDRMAELRQHGYIKIKESGAGNIAAKYCRNPYPTGAAGLELPDLKKSDYSILSGKAETNDEVLI